MTKIQKCKYCDGETFIRYRIVFTLRRGEQLYASCSKCQKSTNLESRVCKPKHNKK